MTDDIIFFDANKGSIRIDLFVDANVCVSIVMSRFKLSTAEWIGG